MDIDPEKLKGAIDRDLVVDLAKRAIETPSPTGEEADFARVLTDVWAELGLESSLQTLYEERFNAVGLRRGADPGAPRVLFSGHMDTSVRGDEDWLVGPGWKNTAVVDDQWIYGNGIFNMKNALVSYTAMVDALNRLDVELPGDIILAGTAGEIELAGVDEFQGRNYDSYGVGMKHLISHGCTADYHILGEPSGAVPIVGMMGTVWTKVTTHGTFAHTAFSDKQVSAVEESFLVWRALDEWIAEFREKYRYMGVFPQVNRAAIRGGAPWRAARTPAVASIYLDIRFPPNVYPIDIQREFAAKVQQIAAAQLQKPVLVDFFMSRPGTRLPSAHPVIEEMVTAHTAVTGIETDAEFAPPYCTDAIESNRYGIPTVVYGAGGRTTPTGAGFGDDDVRAKSGEFIYIDDMVDAAAAYAVAAAGLMARGSEGVARSREIMPIPGVLSD
jgi:succinyl-diaminopimelate desuccinylase